MDERDAGVAEPSRAARWAIGAMYVVLFGTIAGVLTIGSRWAEARAAKDVATRPIVVEIEWPLVPGAEGEPRTWLPQSIRDELTRRAHDAATRWPDPFSPRALRAVGEALMATGWVASIEAVRRETRSDGGEAWTVVRVRGTWRRPVAVVRWQDREHLLAEGGELLPVVYAAGRSGLRAVVGVSSGPPRRGDDPRALAYGAAWPGADVKAALKLLGVVRERAWAGDIVAVDAAHFNEANRLHLVTRWDTRVEWGAPPDQYVPWEQSAAVKIRWLDAIHQRFGRVDGRQAVVDLTGPTVVVDSSVGSGL